MVTPPVRVIRTDADGIADNTEHALVVLEISRREIESGDIASALERLHVLSDSREVTLRYRESVTLMVDGYNSDPRELCEIPEVRTFFARLTAEWPHWMWFLVRDMGAIALLFSLLCTVKVHRNGSQSGTEFLDIGELTSTIENLAERSDVLFDAFDIPVEDAEASFLSALKEIAG